MKIHNYIFLFCVLIIACNPKEEKKQQTTDSPKVNPYAKAELSSKIFSNDGAKDTLLHGFGYDIYMSNSIYIHQPNIPGVNGNRGFSTKENAEKVAQFVIYKIKNNIMPPALNVSELDSLGVLK